MVDSNKKRLFVDMDGTLARFHDQVSYLERMFEKGFFRNLEPFENMVEGIRQFIRNHPDVEVFVLSARVNSEVPYCEEEKNTWLDEHLPEIDQKHRIYTEAGRSKADYIPGGITKNDYLLDDYNKGLNLWLFDGGSSIKCHNNINQRGLGAYGGSAGRMWVGPMVHTEDPPGMIATELAMHMGFSYDLDKVLSTSREPISYFENTPQNPVSIVPDTTAVLVKVERDFSPAHFEATSSGSELSERTTKTFANPLNAVRWLASRTEFQELQLQCSDKTNVSIPYFLADALASNLYGCNIFDLLVSTRDLAEVADAFKLALDEATLPVVGHLHYLSTNGKVGYSAVFHTVEEMKAEIQACYDCGCPITVDWSVQPKSPKEITLYCTPDMGAPEEFKLSPENLRMAAKVCDITLDSIEDFLCEYTWAESSLIWQEYAQYVDKAAHALDGFFSRNQVEENFFKMMSTGLYSPGSAAHFLGAVLESESFIDRELTPGIRITEESTSRPGSKISLDTMITNAEGRQGKHLKDPEPFSPTK